MEYLIYYVISNCVVFVLMHHEFMKSKEFIQVNINTVFLIFMIMIAWIPMTIFNLFVKEEK